MTADEILKRLVDAQDSDVTAAYVVAACNLYPALLSEVKRLRAELKEARERADQLGAALAVAHDRGRCPACLIGNCFTANVIARTLTSTKESPPNAE